MTFCAAGKLLGFLLRVSRMQFCLQHKIRRGFFPLERHRKAFSLRQILKKEDVGKLAIDRSMSSLLCLFFLFSVSLSYFVHLYTFYCLYIKGIRFFACRKKMQKSFSPHLLVSFIFTSDLRLFRVFKSLLKKKASFCSRKKQSMSLSILSQSLPLFVIWGITREKQQERDGNHCS